MQVVINIPEEFEKHFNFDNFEDSLERIKLDVVDSIYCTEASSSGKYEIETIDMLIKAFKECTPLPKNKAPEQEEPILDKIRDEIDIARFIDKDTKLCKNANASGLEVAMQIIDKYKADKKEDKEEDKDIDR